MAGFKVAARKPTSMSKVYDIRQGADESPEAYLERPLEAFCPYTSYDLQTEETTQMVMFAYINQAAPDIGKKK